MEPEETTEVPAAETTSETETPASEGEAAGDEDGE